MTGVELLRRSQDRTPDAVRIVLTAYTDVDSLMEAINTGRIYHFVPKPWDPNELLLVVRRAAERWHLARENAGSATSSSWPTTRSGARRRPPARSPHRSTALIGAGTGLHGAVDLARKILDGETTVLLLGETGHRQGAVRPPHPRQRSPAGEAVRGPELRRPARHLARVRAVRPRPRRLYRRHRRAQGAVRGGRPRHHLPRRGRRDLRRDAAPAPARAPGGRGAPGRRDRRPARWTSGSSPRRTRTSRPRSRPAASVATCTTA